VTRLAVAVVAIALAACGEDPATQTDAAPPADAAIDADPTIDAAPPRETITATQPLAAGELVEGILTGGPSDSALIHLDAQTPTIDWNLHGHNGGGTQMVFEELGKMTVDYTYVPASNGDWFVLIRNGGSANMDVQVRVDLYGAMAWRWQ
jgi:hypothetical protein